MTMTHNASKLNGCHVLLGVSGGVAAYKAVDLASKLTAKGAQVKCVLTHNAAEFIKPLSFEAVTAQPVFLDMWKEPDEYHIGHISLAQWADLVVVAPATANIIAKVACGICDDLLSTILCACWDKPFMMAPAMNNKMWTNPAVQKNIGILNEMNLSLVGPETGRLACGTEGVGRMAEPQDILNALETFA